MIETQTYIIADIDPFEEYECCPNCESKEISFVISGPLSNFSQCLECNVLYAPEVNFKREDDE